MEKREEKKGSAMVKEKRDFDEFDLWASSSCNGGGGRKKEMEEGDERDEMRKKEGGAIIICFPEITQNRSKF